MTHGLNANLVHGWRKLTRERDVAVVVRRHARRPCLQNLPQV